MTRHAGLSQWYEQVSTHLPQLSRPQALGLVLWSMGIVLAQRVGLVMVAVVMAHVCMGNVRAMRGRLREWYLDGAAKRGDKRRTLDVRTCFAPLLRWVIHLHPAGSTELALAMDASTLGQRFTVLSVHVVICGCALPVAWAIVRATDKGAWRPHWEALLQDLTGSVPDGWRVIVLADRGLYAKWLYEAIVAVGWHPFLRINRQGTSCPTDSDTFRPLMQVITVRGTTWRGTVRCFTAARQLTCTLVARWDAGYTDPWIVLTDLPPETADVAWYGLRAWIECGYKDMKRGGWHWEQTKMADPARAERLWLALAVATLVVVSVGVHAEATAPQPSVDHLPPTHSARRRKGTQPTRHRSISGFQHGRLLIIAAFVDGRPLPPMALIPEPWPKSLYTPNAHSDSRLPHQNAA